MTTLIHSPAMKNTMIAVSFAGVSVLWLWLWLFVAPYWLGIRCHQGQCEGHNINGRVGYCDAASCERMTGKPPATVMQTSRLRYGDEEVLP